MDVGCCNPLDLRHLSGVKFFETDQAAADQRAAGLLAGVLSTTPPRRGARRGAVVDEVQVVALARTPDAGSLSGLICAASPEQRDVLAEMVGAAVPRDLKLLTQQQYLQDSACVDVFVTAVRHPSAFLASLPQPVFMRDLPAPDAAFPADTYPNTFNLASAACRRAELRLWT